MPDDRNKQQGQQKQGGSQGQQAPSRNPPDDKSTGGQGRQQGGQGQKGSQDRESGMGGEKDRGQEHTRR